MEREQMRRLSGAIVVSTSPNRTSNSRIMAHQAAAIVKEVGMDVTFFDCRQLDPVWTVKEGTAPGAKGWAALKEAVADSSLIILTAPIYFYTVGSPARVVVENLGELLHLKHILLLTAAGSQRSHLAAHDFRESLMAEHDCLVFPQTVQVTDEDFDGESLKDELMARLERVILQVVATVKLAKQHPSPGTRPREV